MRPESVYDTRGIWPASYMRYVLRFPWESTSSITISSFIFLKSSMNESTRRDFLYHTFSRTVLFHTMFYFSLFFYCIIKTVQYIFRISSSPFPLAYSVQIISFFPGGRRGLAPVKECGKPWTGPGSGGGGGGGPRRNLSKR